jgi:hypothetical protein
LHILPFIIILEGRRQRDQAAFALNGNDLDIRTSSVGRQLSDTNIVWSVEGVAPRLERKGVFGALLNLVGAIVRAFHGGRQRKSYTWACGARGHKCALISLQVF